MNRLLNFLFFTSIGIIAPLIFKPQLILHPKLIVVIIAAGVMVFSGPPITSSGAKKNKQNDKSTVLILTILGAISLTAPIIEWAYFSKITNDYNYINFIGLALIIIGFIIRLTAIRQLGKQFTATVQIVKEHQLINTGLYSILRHPSYTGALITYVGSPLWLDVYYSIFIVASCMTLAYYLRIKAEEELLNKTFGTEYADYSKKTWRLFPYVW